MRKTSIPIKVKRYEEVITNKKTVLNIWKEDFEELYNCPVNQDGKFYNEFLKKDPYIPFNYIGISLLSCVSKAYTSILNNIITNYCEDNNILEDEQNLFIYINHVPIIYLV